MSSRIRKFVALGCVAGSLSACSSGGLSGGNAPLGSSPLPRSADAKGGGGGGNGSGPTQIPPPPKVDGPAWYVFNGSAASGAASPNVDFNAIKNSVQGAQSIGSTRVASEIVFNTSKKTALTLTQIAIHGANPGDFTISAASLSAALNKPISTKQGGIGLQVNFAPAAEGVRNAVLHLVSNAGTMDAQLTGTGLPDRPIIDTASAFAFLPASASANFTIANDGGKALIINSFGFAGTNAKSFQLFSANSGQSNCFAGAELGAHSFCYLSIGLAPGAPVPSNAHFAILTNDPNVPEKDIALTLTQN